MAYLNNKNNIGDNTNIAILAKPGNIEKISNPSTNLNNKIIKDKKIYNVKASFYITYVLLFTTSLITFIEAMRTQNPLIRHIFNLETCISLIGGYFYSVFISQLDDCEKRGIHIDWDVITKTRYIDWFITTPIMLLTLCMVLAKESKTLIHLSTFLIIVFLNYAMLYIGYLGETNMLNRNIACIGGFIPFAMIFYIIYKKYTITTKGISKYFLLILYVIIWSLYGLVYLLDESSKNIAMNILDCIAKCLVGIFIWVYYTNIIPKW
jgi:bacteriorhodopsin